MSKATEMVLYRTCKRMIERGSTDGLAEKIDISQALYLVKSVVLNIVEYLAN